MGNPTLLLWTSRRRAWRLWWFKLAAQVLQLKEEGMTIVLSGNVRFTTMVSDRAYVLEKGHVRHEGDAGKNGRRRPVLGKFLRI
jgi:branched-chain amino acid transport system ATP-binding protein